MRNDVRIFFVRVDNEEALTRLGVVDLDLNFDKILRNSSGNQFGKRVPLLRPRDHRESLNFGVDKPSINLNSEID